MSLRSAWDRFVGPENTASENALTLVTAAAGTALSVALAKRAGSPASRQVVMGLIALDLWGGLAANNTRSCARWYERPGQGTAEHLQFSLAHVQPFVVAWCDRNADAGSRDQGTPPWAWAVSHYAFLQAATLAIRLAGPTHRRLAGVILTCLGLAVDRGLGPRTTAPWFGPVLYGKLLLGHASAALWSDAQLSAAAVLPVLDDLPAPDPAPGLGRRPDHKLQATAEIEPG